VQSCGQGEEKANHLPPALCLPTNKPIGLVQRRLERGVGLDNGCPGCFAAFEDFASRLSVDVVFGPPLLPALIVD
jgi:hypothetical protein